MTRLGKWSVLVVTICIAWFACSRHLNHPTARGFAVSVPAPTGWTAKSATVRADDAPFHCDGRKYCSQMSSCDEAKYFLSNCPDVKMDGDHDGIPCERQWCNVR
jgi:hypothetical protein